MSRRNLALLVGGLGIALLVVLLLAPNASSHPDGLERVADDKGFLEEAKDAPYELLPDYTIPGVENETVTTILAGAVGTLAVAAIALGAGWLLRSRSRGPEPESRDPDAPASPGRA